MPRQAYVLLENKAIIFYSYKAGNSSLVEWIFDMLKPRGPAALEIRRKRPFLNSPNIDIHADLAFELIREHGFRGAILTRNPYARAASGFINKFVRDGALWLRTERAYEKCAIDLMGDSPAFSFIDYLMAIRESKGPRNTRRLDQHFKTQVDPRYSEYMRLLKIVRIEQVGTDMPEFCNDTGIPFDHFPRERSTETADAGICEGDDLSRVDCYRLATDRCLPKYEQLYSPDAIALVNEIYGIDFEHLGYEKK